MFGARGSEQNGVVVDGDVVRVLVATDTFSHVAAGDHIPRVHRQVPRCPQAVHQAAAGPLRGECCGCVLHFVPSRFNRHAPGWSFPAYLAVFFDRFFASPHLISLLSSPLLSLETIVSRALASFFVARALGERRSSGLSRIRPMISQNANFRSRFSS